MNNTYAITERKGPPVLRDLPRPTLSSPESTDNSDPQPTGQIANAWLLHTDRIDSLTRLVEMLENKFAPVCSPACDKSDLKSTDTEVDRRQSDMADSLNFQSRRVIVVIDKLGSLLERCQL